MHWDSTTLIVVEVEGGGQTGLGYTYTDASVVGLITGKLAEATHDHDAMDSLGAWRTMQRAVRKHGPRGTGGDRYLRRECAVWDLKARLLDMPLALLLGRYRDAVPIYGSGGFTT